MSKNTFGYGFYQADIKTIGKTPYDGAFWLQGDNLEINVVEFTMPHVAISPLIIDGNEYFSKTHCFDAQNTAGTTTVAGKKEGYTAAFSNEFVTYGVLYNSSALTFYRNGVAVRTVNPQCLGAEDSLSIGFSHETNPDFGGCNDAGEWASKCSSKQADAHIHVANVGYWKATIQTTVTTATTTTATTTTNSTGTPFDAANCPYNSVTSPETCWADSAYRTCLIDPQGTYNTVMKHKGSMEQMYLAFVQLNTTEVGCTRLAAATTTESSTPNVTTSAMLDATTTSATLEATTPIATTTQPATTATPAPTLPATDPPAPTTPTTSSNPTDRAVLVLQQQVWSLKLQAEQASELVTRCAASAALPGCARAKASLQEVKVALVAAEKKLNTADGDAKRANSVISICYNKLAWWAVNEATNTAQLLKDIAQGTVRLVTEKTALKEDDVLSANARPCAVDRVRSARSNVGTAVDVTLKSSVPSSVAENATRMIEALSPAEKEMVYGVDKRATFETTVFVAASSQAPVQCSKGTFSNNTVDCQVCPTGTDTSQRADDRACPCLDGFWRQDRFGACSSCAGQTGTQCSSDCISLQEGFFWYSSDPTFSDQLEAHCSNLALSGMYDRSITQLNGTVGPAYECPRSAHCQGGHSSSCENGYIGPLCAQCSATHFGLNGDCLQCPEGTAQTAGAVVALVVIIGLLVLAVYTFVKISANDVGESWQKLDRLPATGSHIVPEADKMGGQLRPDGAAVSSGPGAQRPKSTWHDASGEQRPWWAPHFTLSPLLKIHLSFLQIQGAMMTTFSHVPWPNNLRSFHHAVQFAFISPFNLLLPSCAFSGFTPSAISDFWSPLAAVLLFLVVIVLAYSRKVCQTISTMTDLQRTKGSLGLFKAQCVAAALALYYCLYPIIAVATVSLLAPCHTLCSEVDENGRQTCDDFLRADYRTQCTGEAYGTHFAIGWVVFVLFAVLYPLVIAGYLTSRKPLLDNIERATNTPLLEVAVPANRLAMQDPWLLGLGFTYQNYRPKGHLYLWDSWNLLSKLLITSFPLFIEPNTAGQILAGVLFAAITFTTVLASRPFRNKWENNMASLGSGFVLATILAGALLFSAELEPGTGSSAAAGAVLVILETAFHVLCIGSYISMYVHGRSADYSADGDAAEVWRRDGRSSTDAAAEYNAVSDALAKGNKKGLRDAGASSTNVDEMHAASSFKPSLEGTPQSWEGGSDAGDAPVTANNPQSWEGGSDAGDAPGTANNPQSWEGGSDAGDEPAAWATLGDYGTAEPGARSPGRPVLEELPSDSAYTDPASSNPRGSAHFYPGGNDVSGW